jgi:CHASE2 domain-containing sensor protein
LRLSPEARYLLKSLTRKWGRSFFQIGLALLGTILCAVFHLSIGASLDIDLLRPFYSIRGPRPSPPQVVIVAVDDLSYQALEASTNYPLPRKFIATALEVIQKEKPRLLILDAKIPNERLIDADADNRIANSLGAMPSTIWSGENPDQDTQYGSAIQIPSDEKFRAAAKMELPMLMYGNGTYTTYLTSRVSNPRSVDDLVPLAKPLRELGKISLTPPGPYDLINFYGTAGAIPRISIHTLVTGVPSEATLTLLRDAVILVGYQSIQYGRGPTNKEELPTPSAPDGMFGVEIHATVVANLIDGTMLRTSDPATQFTSLCGLITVLAAFAMRYPTPLALAGLWSAYGVVLLTSFILFSWYNLVFAGLSTLCFALVLISLGMGTYFFMRATSYKAYIDRVFSFEKEQEL